MPDSKPSHNREVIETVEVVAAPQSDNTLATRSSRSLPAKTWLWLGFLALLILAIYVIFLLPSAIDKNQSDSDTTEGLPPSTASDSNVAIPTELLPTLQPTEEIASSATVDETTNLQAKTQTEELLTQLIELETLLEKHAVKKWAAEEFAQGAEQGRIGDEFFRRQQYAQAIESFRAAINQLQVLQEQIQPTLERALARGEQALMQGDQPAALQQFELAKAIAPTNTRAINGLQRAITIEQLFVLLQRGSSFESHDQLQQAKSTYQEAIELDPLSNEAKTALSRVDTKLKDKEFKQMIAAAYQALQNGQYADARAAFNDAKKLKPDSKEPSIGLNKVAAAIRNEKIANLLFEAEHFVQLQQWTQAATSYEKILQLNNAHNTAQQGLLESTAKAKVLVDLKAALESADQLHQAKILQKAEQVLAAISKLNSVGSIIEQHANELQQLVRIATTPIPIVLESDNNTDVVVYKVARLGTFSRTELQLRPGPYTIVGTRTGYRDVRKTIKVTPESKNTILSILCEEPI